MDYSYLLNTAKPDFNKLKLYGFSSSGSEYSIVKPVGQTDFYVKISIDEKEVKASVFENSTDERYVLFDVLTARGSFITDIREKVQAIIDEIKDAAFETTDVKQKFVDYLFEAYGTVPDYPWKDDDESAVFRCKNSKWYALLMHIPFNKVGINSEQKVWAVNIKHDSEDIKRITDFKSIFPAWHMQKKYWMTVLLTDVIDFDYLCRLVNESYKLVETKF